MANRRTGSSSHCLVFSRAAEVREKGTTAALPASFTFAGSLVCVWCIVQYELLRMPSRIDNLGITMDGVALFFSPFFSSSPLNAGLRCEIVVDILLCNLVGKSLVARDPLSNNLTCILSPHLHLSC